MTTNPQIVRILARVRGEKPNEASKKPRSDGPQQETIKLDPDHGERMLAAVHNLLGRFVSYPSEDAQVAHTLWCVHAHLMHLWDSTPRLAFLSPEPASGKSRALEITKMLVPKPVWAVNVSPTYLFRKVGEEGEGSVTLLYDEIDAVFGPKAKENEDTRALLNAGHRKGAVAGRCVVRGKIVETEEIPAYAALAVAGLGWLPDTLMSRSIVIRMRPRHSGEAIEPYRPRLHDAQGAEVYRLIKLWAATQTAVTWPQLPDAIQDRDADCWEPLIAVADAAGGHWPTRARVAAVSLVAAAQDREASLGVRLLMDARAIFNSKQYEEVPHLSTKVLLHELTSMEEAPWGDLRGKPLHERGLAHRLRQYSIKSRQVRIGDDTLKGYRREDFADAWKRYSPTRHDASETSETTETKFAGLSPDVSDVSNVSLLPAAQAEASPDPDDYTYHLDDQDDINDSVADDLKAIKERQAAGGPGLGEYPELPDFLRRETKS